MFVPFAMYIFLLQFTLRTFLPRSTFLRVCAILFRLARFLPRLIHRLARMIPSLAIVFFSTRLCTHARDDEPN